MTPDPKDNLAERAFVGAWGDHPNLCLWFNGDRRARARVSLLRKAAAAVHTRYTGIAAEMTCTAAEVVRVGGNGPAEESIRR